MHIQLVDDLRIMPRSWWVTFGLNLFLAVMLLWFAVNSQSVVTGFFSGVAFTIAITHVHTWSIFFAPQQRWINHKRQELKQLFEERGLTWPE